MAEADLQFEIEVTGGPLAGRTLAVPLGRPFVMGRLAECDIAIETDGTVSRRHCQIDWHPPSGRLKNLSANGTQLNGREVDSADLVDGDEIRMGNETILLVRIHDHGETDDQAQSEPPSFESPVTSAPAAVASASTPERLESDDLETASATSGEDNRHPCSLAVIHGPSAGTTIELTAGKPLVIGSHVGCGLVIEQDKSVSREHFRIELIPPECHLYDLSSNGTFVNGRKTGEAATLTDGDEVEIGHNTVIKVSLEFAASSHGGAVAIPAVSPRECRSGLVLMTAEPETEFSLWSVAERFSGLSQMSAVVDFAKSGIPLPENLTEPNYLLDSLPAETIAQRSPVILSSDDRAGLQTVVTDGTGEDALIIIFSQSKADELHEHLKSLANSNPGTGGHAHGETLFAFWWPSLLGKILEHSEHELVEQIMTGIDAILVETADEDAWCIFATEDFAQQLERLKLVQILEESPQQSDAEA